MLGLRRAAAAGALGSFTAMGRAFLPEFNEGTLTISAVTLPGTSLAESDQLGAALERIMRTFRKWSPRRGEPAARSWTSTFRASSRRRSTLT